MLLARTFPDKLKSLLRAFRQTECILIQLERSLVDPIYGI